MKLGIFHEFSFEPVTRQKHKNHQCRRTARIHTHTHTHTVPITVTKHTLYIGKRPKIVSMRSNGYIIALRIHCLASETHIFWSVSYRPHTLWAVHPNEFVTLIPFAKQTNKLFFFRPLFVYVWFFGFRALHSFHKVTNESTHKIGHDYFLIDVN